jgi:hypothetical protein
MGSPFLSCNHQFSFQSYPLGLLALVTTHFVSLSPKAPLRCFASQVCFAKIKHQHNFFNLLCAFDALQACYIKEETTTWTFFFFLQCKFFSLIFFFLLHAIATILELIFFLVTHDCYNALLCKKSNDNASLLHKRRRKNVAQVEYFSSLL